MIDAIHPKQVQVQHEVHIIEAARKDPAAFEPLYRKYFPGIFRFILNRTGDREITGDLTSQVFLNALNHLAGYEFRGLPLSSWLYRIALNTTNEYFRKVKRSRYVILDSGTLERVQDSMGSEDSGIGFDPELIKKVFETLNDQEIELVEMRFFEELSYRTIGEILGITENNAKVKLYRVLANIKSRLLP